MSSKNPPQATYSRVVILAQISVACILLFCLFRPLSEPFYTNIMLFPTTVAELPRPSVCVLQPIFSSDMHLLAKSLRSFLQTMEDERFQYRFYFGFTEENPFWNYPQLREQFKEIVQSNIVDDDDDDDDDKHKQDAIVFLWMRLYHGMNSNNSFTSSYNTLALRAFSENCTYFVYAAEHTEYQTQQWMSKTTEQLSSFFIPNFGLVALCNIVNNCTLPVVHVTHRTHMEFVFDEFGPIYCPVSDFYGRCSTTLFDIYAPFGAAIIRSDLLISIQNEVCEIDTALGTKWQFLRNLRNRALVVLKHHSFYQPWMPEQHALQYIPSLLWQHSMFTWNSTLRNLVILNENIPL